MEPGDEVLVEDGDFAIEDEDVGAQLRDGGGDLGETAGVVDSTPTQEANVRAFLVGDDPPPVDLFLVDPSVAMEGRTGERRGHRSERTRYSEHRFS